MGTRIREDRRLRQLSATCLALPEAERTICGVHADFRVRGRIFAYFLRNHGGDGIISACFKSSLGEHVEHVRRSPDRFYLPQYLGRRGWFGIRLDQGEINWDEVKALAVVSYNLVASKGLRGAAAPLANALTARTLRRGSPPPFDATLLEAGPPPAERAEMGRLLRPTPVTGAATNRRSGALRGRR